MRSGKTTATRKLTERPARTALGTAVTAAVGLGAWLAPVVLDRDARRFLTKGHAVTAGRPSDIPTEPTERWRRAATAPWGSDPLVAHARVNGTTLPYRELGDGPPVLFVHGAGGGWWAFDEVGAHLADTYRTIAYSRRGFTGAGEPATSMAQHQEDAAALLEHLDARGAVVAALGGGGAVAVDLAVECPDLVAGLILLEPTLLLRQHATADLLRVALALQVRRWFLPDEQAIIPLYRFVFEHDDGFNPWDAPDFPEQLRYGILATAAAVYADLAGSAHGLRSVPSEVLAGLDLPVTLLVGQRTQPLFRRIVDTLEELMPGAMSLEVPEAGHVMSYDNPKGVADAIRYGVVQML